MNQEFYKNYIDTLRDTIQNGVKRGEIRKVNNAIGSIQNKSSVLRKGMNYTMESDQKLFSSLAPLSSISGKKVNYHLEPGKHPDFIHINTETAFEFHYITSVFIDVKRSMNLFKKYYPRTVADIINVIQRAAVHTAWYFDGYVQRYHGDGLFLYFGGKNVTIEESVRQALTATSFISYFMCHDLKKLFTEQGIENMFTRIGIDLGEDEDVLWYMAGMGECNEITTCSLHTSLASKLQNIAPSNGIAVGDNIKTRSNLPSDLFRYLRDASGKTIHYAFDIPDEKFFYKQWDFNWETYLKNLPNIHRTKDGDLYIDNSAPSIIIPNTDYLGSRAKQITPWAK